MPSVSPKCPNCGAPVQVGETSCRFCQAAVLFGPDMQEVRLVGFPCPKCGNLSERGSSFCGKCGQPLVVKCSSCRSDMPLGVSICPHCRASRVVKALIADAEVQKEKAEEEAKGQLALIQSQVDGHATFRTIAERLSAEAEQMRGQTEGLRHSRSRSAMISVLAILGAFAGGILIFVLFAVLASAMGSGDLKGAPAVAGCVCPGALFLVLLALGLVFAYKAHAAGSEARRLAEGAAARMAPGAWRSFGSPDEETAVQAVFRWADERRAAVEEGKKRKIAEIDARLEETVDSLK